MGWFAMTSLFESAGMNHPSSGTPSSDGKNTSSYSMPNSSGRRSTGVRNDLAKNSAMLLMNWVDSLAFIGYLHEMPGTIVWPLRAAHDQAFNQYRLRRDQREPHCAAPVVF